MKNIINTLFKNNKLNKSSEAYIEFKNDFTYHSSKIEGSTISSYENMNLITKKVKKEELEKLHEKKYVIENMHLIEVFDYVIETYNESLTETYIKKIHNMLCWESPDLLKREEKAGEYRKHDVHVGNHLGARPVFIAKLMKELISLEKSNMNLNDISKFHCEFETIHPFYDGNGRTGRMIMLKQCLMHNVPLFFINDESKAIYYNALRYYNITNKFTAMSEYCKEQQEIFKNKYTK